MKPYGRLDQPLPFLRKQLELLRGFGVSADVGRIATLESEIRAKFNQQLVATFDRDHSTAGFLAEIILSWVIFLQAARRDFRNPELGTHRYRFLAKQPEREQLPRNLAERQREVGTRDVKALDILGTINAGDHRNVGC